MRFRPLRWFLPLIILGMLLPAMGIASGESRVALVIGNSEYGPAIGKLKNPVNDAKLMAETLKGLGFSVDLVLDADQKAMKRAVKGFGAKLREAGSEATGLFYYAGHGVQVDGTNFLLPVGAEIEAEADVEIESIAADDVMTQMQSAGNAVNLVFLDACRNNPLARTSRSATRGLARLDAPRGSFVGYSTAPGDVAADGDGANSPYALALVEELKKPGISIEEAHRNVRAKVLAESGNKQTPWDSSSLTGPVVLTANAAPEPVSQAAPTPPIPQQAAVNMEAMFWESIKDSTDATEFEAYLQQYPQGSFAPLATAKIAKLNATTQAARTVSQEPAAGASTEKTIQGSAPAPSTRIAVTADIKEQIDKYIKNCNGQGAKRCYIAVSKDGTSTALGRWETTWGQYEVNARKNALRDCGGAGKCEIIFRGSSLLPGIEIVVQ